MTLNKVDTASPSTSSKTRARTAAYPIAWAAGSCWLAAWLVVVVGSHTSAPVWAAAAVIACAGLPAALTRVRRRARPERGFDSHLASLALVCAAVAAVSAALSVNAIITSPLAQAARNHSVLTAQVRITGDPHEVRAKVQPQWDAEPMWVADATVTSVRVNRRGWNCSTPVRLLMRAADATRMHMGQVWQVVARAAPSRVGDRSAAYLHVLAAPVLHADAPWWARAADSWRTGLRRAAESANQDARGLLPALAIGDTSLAPPALTEDMRTAGLSHLSAVSGANVSIVLAAVVVLALLCGVRGRWLAVVCLVTLAWFVLVARPSPSVVRAAVMGAIGVLPVLAGWRRKPGGVDALLALALAASVLIVIDPWLSVSWGFALSCAATAGLVTGASVVMRRLQRHIGPHALAAATQPGQPPVRRRGITRLTHRLRIYIRAGRERVLSWFIAAASVTLCAQLAVTPLMLAMGAPISWVALPANLLAEPAVAPATVSGLLASALSQVSPAAASVAAKPGLLATSWISAVAHRSARVAESMPVSALWNRRGFPADTVAVLCDVGQGTALAIPLGEGRAIVVDAGPDPEAIDGCLRRLGVSQVPLLLLSHFHADHIAGLPGVLRNRVVGTVLVSPLAEPAAGAKFVREQLASRDVTPVRVASGASVTVARARVDVLSPTVLLLDVDSPPNDDCVAAVITVDVRWRSTPMRVLAPCDLEFAGQSRLLAAHPALPGYFDIALVPHHGSSKQVPAFAHWASPTVALIPVGRDNDYGHPAADAVRLWGEASVRLLRTDLDGDAAVTEDSLAQTRHP